MQHDTFIPWNCKDNNCKINSIKTINTNYMGKLGNSTNWKKILTIHSTNNYIRVTAKSNTAFTTFNGKNGKKMLFDLMKKKITKIYY